MNMPEFWDRVKLYIKVQKTKQDAVALESGINPKTLKQQIHHGRLPDVEQGVKIAQFLHTSVEYLVSGKNLQGKELSPQALIMAEKYDVLTDKQKQLVDATIDEFLNQEEPKYMEGKEPRATGRGKSA